MLVLSLGVMFSTFVSGPVALLATVFMVIVGLFSSFVVELASGTIVGGGPLESANRIVTGDNMIPQLPPGIRTSTIKAVDQATALAMRYFSAVVPDFNDCYYGRHLAFGFDVGRDLLARCLIREPAFVLPVMLLGYLALNNGSWTNERRKLEIRKPKFEQITNAKAECFKHWSFRLAICS